MGSLKITKLKKSPTSFGLDYLDRRTSMNQWILSPIIFICCSWRMGYPTHFGQMECLKLIASSKFPDAWWHIKGAKGKSCNCNWILGTKSRRHFGMTSACQAIWFGWCKMSLLQVQYLILPSDIRMRTQEKWHQSTSSCSMRPLQTVQCPSFVFPHKPWLKLVVCHLEQSTSPRTCPKTTTLWMLQKK